MAAAVTELFPNAQYGIGPPIDGGFYHVYHFSASDIEASTGRDILVLASAGDLLVGGMTYRIDPSATGQ